LGDVVIFCCPPNVLFFTLKCLHGNEPTLNTPAVIATRSLYARLMLVLGLLVLAGCSSTTFVYNRLHIFVPWYLGGYVDLEREQKDVLDESLRPLLDWHRREELPRYVALLDDMESALDEELTIERITDFALAFEGAWFRLEERGVAGLLDVAESLSDAQMAEFIEELWHRQAEYEDKYLSRTDEEFREDSYKDLRDSMQDYLGRLNSAQRDLLQQASAALQRTDDAWLAERRNWIQRLEVFLQREPGWREAILDALDTRDETVSEAYRLAYQHNLQVIAGSAAEVINMRLQKQDRRLRRKLDGFREDFQTLIAQGQAQADAA